MKRRKDEKDKLRLCQKITLGEYPRKVPKSSNVVNNAVTSLWVAKMKTVKQFYFVTGLCHKEDT